MATHNVYADAVRLTWADEYSAADSSCRVVHPVTILNTNTTNLEIVPLPKNELRCRYCDTKAFEGERRCVACGAPL